MEWVPKSCKTPDLTEQCDGCETTQAGGPKQVDEHARSVTPEVTLPGMSRERLNGQMREDTPSMNDAASTADTVNYDMDDEVNLQAECVEADPVPEWSQILNENAHLEYCLEQAEKKFKQGQKRCQELSELNFQYLNDRDKLSRQIDDLEKGVEVKNADPLVSKLQEIFKRKRLDTVGCRKSEADGDSTEAEFRPETSRGAIRNEKDEKTRKLEKDVAHFQTLLKAEKEKTKELGEKLQEKHEALVNYQKLKADFGKQVSQLKRAVEFEKTVKKIGADLICCQETKSRLEDDVKRLQSLLKVEKGKLEDVEEKLQQKHDELVTYEEKENKFEKRAKHFVAELRIEQERSRELEEKLKAERKQSHHLVDGLRKLHERFIEFRQKTLEKDSRTMEEHSRRVSQVEELMAAKSESQKKHEDLVQRMRLGSEAKMKEDEAKVFALKEKCKELQSQLTACRNESQKQHEDLMQKMRLESKAQTKPDQEERCKDLQSQLDGCRSNCSQFEAQVKEYKGKFSAIEEKCRKLQSQQFELLRNSQVKARFKENQATISALEERCRQLQSEISRISQFETRFEEGQAKISMLEERCLHLQSHSQHTENSQYETRVKEYEAKISVLQEQCRQLQSRQFDVPSSSHLGVQLREDQEKVWELEEQCKNLQSQQVPDPEISKLEQERAQLAQESPEHKQECQELEQKCRRLEQEHRELEQKCQQIEEDRRHLEREQQLQQGRKEEHQQLQQECRRIEQKCHSLQEENKILEQQCSHYEQECKNLREDGRNISFEVENEQERSQDLCELLKLKHEEFLKIQGEKEELEKKAESFGSELMKVQNESQDVVQLLEKERQELAKCRQERDQSNKKLKAGHAHILELDKLVETLQRDRKDRDQLDANLKEAQAQVSQLELKCDQLQRDAEAFSCQAELEREYSVDVLDQLKLRQEELTWWQEQRNNVDADLEHFRAELEKEQKRSEDLAESSKRTEVELEEYVKEHNELKTKFKKEVEKISQLEEYVKEHNELKAKFKKEVEKISQLEKEKEVLVACVKELGTDRQSNGVSSSYNLFQAHHHLQEFKGRAQIAAIKTEGNDADDMHQRIGKLESEKRDLVQTLAELNQLCSGNETPSSNVQVKTEVEEQRLGYPLRESIRRLLERIEKLTELNESQVRIIEHLSEELKKQQDTASSDWLDDRSRLKGSLNEFQETARNLRGQLQVERLAVESLKDEKRNLVEHLEKSENEVKHLRVRLLDATKIECEQKMEFALLQGDAKLWSAEKDRLQDLMVIAKNEVKGLQEKVSNSHSVIAELRKELGHERLQFATLSDETKNWDSERYQLHLDLEGAECEQENLRCQLEKLRDGAKCEDKKVQDLIAQVKKLQQNEVELKRRLNLMENENKDKDGEILFYRESLDVAQHQSKQGQCREVSVQIEVLRREKQKLLELLSEKEKEITLITLDLKQQEASFRETVDSKESTLVTVQEAVSNLTKQLNCHRSKADELVKVIQQKEKEALDMKKKNDQKLADKELVITSLEKKITDMEVDFAFLQTEQEVVKVAQNSNENLIGELRKDRESMEYKISELNLKNMEINMKNTELIGQNAELAAKLAKVEKLVGMKDDIMETCKEQLVYMSHQLDNFYTQQVQGSQNKDLGNISEKLAEREAQLKEQERQLAEEKMQGRKQSELLAEKEKTIAKSEEDLKKKEESLKLEKNGCNHVNETRTIVDNALNLWEARLKKKEDDLVAREELLNGCHLEINELASAVTTLETDVKQLNEKLYCKESGLAAYRQRCENMENSMKAMREDLVKERRAHESLKVMIAAKKYSGKSVKCMTDASLLENYIRNGKNVRTVGCQTSPFEDKTKIASCSKDLTSFRGIGHASMNSRSKLPMRKTKSVKCMTDVSFEVLESKLQETKNVKCGHCHDLQNHDFQNTSTEDTNVRNHVLSSEKPLPVKKTKSVKCMTEFSFELPMKLPELKDLKSVECQTVRNSYGNNFCRNCGVLLNLTSEKVAAEKLSVEKTEKDTISVEAESVSVEPEESNDVEKERNQNFISGTQNGIETKICYVMSDTDQDRLTCMPVVSREFVLMDKRQDGSLALTPSGDLSFSAEVSMFRETFRVSAYEDLKIKEKFRELRTSLENLKTEIEDERDSVGEKLLILSDLEDEIRIIIGNMCDENQTLESRVASAEGEIPELQACIQTLEGYLASERLAHSDMKDKYIKEKNLNDWLERKLHEARVEVDKVKKFAIYPNTPMKNDEGNKVLLTPLSPVIPSPLPSMKKKRRKGGMRSMAERIKAAKKSPSKPRPRPRSPARSKSPARAASPRDPKLIEEPKVVITSMEPVLEKKSPEAGSSSPQKPSTRGKQNKWCPVCSEIFSSAIELKIHMIKHPRQEQSLKPYKCHKCNRGFTHMHNLRAHNKIHLKKTPPNTDGNVPNTETQPVETLAAQAKSSGNVVPSKTAETETAGPSSEKMPKILPENPGTTTSSGNLTGKKEFHCPFCPKVCHSEFNYQSHLCIHTGKSHKCNVCQKMFTLKCNLVRHMTKHEQGMDTQLTVKTAKKLAGKAKGNIRKIVYPCDVCKATLMSKGELAKHKKQEHKPKPKKKRTVTYTCPICDKEFFLQTKLVFHMETEHQISMDSNLSTAETSEPVLQPPELAPTPSLPTPTLPLPTPTLPLPTPTLPLVTLTPPQPTPSSPPTESSAPTPTLPVPRPFKRSVVKNVHQCPTCQKCFRKRKKLNMHMKGHSLTSSLSPPIPSPETSISAETLPPPAETPSLTLSFFQCSKCERCFKDRLGLVSHMKAHRKKKGRRPLTAATSISTPVLLPMPSPATPPPPPPPPSPPPPSISESPLPFIQESEPTLPVVEEMPSLVVNQLTLKKKKRKKGEPSQGPLQCHLCERRFSQKCNLIGHYKLTHDICMYDLDKEVLDRIDACVESFVCDQCGRVFNQKCTYIVHLKSTHGALGGIVGKKLKVPGKKLKVPGKKRKAHAKKLKIPGKGKKMVLLKNPEEKKKNRELLKLLDPSNLKQAVLEENSVGAVLKRKRKVLKYDSIAEELYTCHFCGKDYVTFWRYRMHVEECESHQKPKRKSPRGSNDSFDKQLENYALSSDTETYVSEETLSISPGKFSPWSSPEPKSSRGSPQDKPISDSEVKSRSLMLGENESAASVEKFSVAEENASTPELKMQMEISIGQKRTKSPAGTCSRKGYSPVRKCRKMLTVNEFESPRVENSSVTKSEESQISMKECHVVVTDCSSKTSAEGCIESSGSKLNTGETCKLLPNSPLLPDYESSDDDFDDLPLTELALKMNSGQKQSPKDSARFFKGSSKSVESEKFRMSAHKLSTAVPMRISPRRRSWDVGQVQDKVPPSHHAIRVLDFSSCEEETSVTTRHAEPTYRTYPPPFIHPPRQRHMSEENHRRRKSRWDQLPTDMPVTQPKSGLSVYDFDDDDLDLRVPQLKSHEMGTDHTSRSLKLSSHAALQTSVDKQSNVPVHYQKSLKTFSKSSPSSCTVGGPNPQTIGATSELAMTSTRSCSIGNVDSIQYETTSNVRQETVSNNSSDCANNLYKYDEHASNSLKSSMPKDGEFESEHASPKVEAFSLNTSLACSTEKPANLNTPTRRTSRGHSGSGNRFICNICGEGFKYHSLYNRHMRVSHSVGHSTDWTI